METLGASPRKIIHKTPILHRQSLSRGFTKALFMSASPPPASTFVIQESTLLSSPLQTRSSPVTGFGDIVTHYEDIRQQVTCGLKVVKRMQSFFQKYSKLHESFACDLAKITQHEREKLQTIKVPDQMSSCFDACIGFFGKMKEMTTVFRAISRNYLKKVFEPLSKFYQSGCKKLADGETFAQGTIDNLTSLKDSIFHEKAKCIQKLETYDKFHKKDPTSKQTIRALEKARHACEQYENVLPLAEKKYAQRSTLVPVLLTFQSLEEGRLNCLIDSFKQHATLQNGMFSSLQYISDTFMLLASSISTKDDVKSFVDHLTKSNPKSNVLSQTFVYDLKLTSSDLASESLKMKSQKLFENTINGTMIAEQKLEVDDDINVPMVLDVLINAIDDTEGGFETEGIFRISARLEERNELEAQLEAGDFIISTTSPHIPAGVLKRWLRDLAEPLIPNAFYGECIEFAMKTIEGELQEASIQEQLQNIIDKLPQLNMNIISRIIELMKQVSKFENKNKMSVANLAIVFAPSFLRSASEVDPSKILFESKIAAQFVSIFVEWMPDQYTTNFDSSKAMLKLPPPPPLREWDYITIAKKGEKKEPLSTRLQKLNERRNVRVENGSRDMDSIDINDKKQKHIVTVDIDMNIMKRKSKKERRKRHGSVTGKFRPALARAQTGAAQALRTKRSTTLNYVHTGASQLRAKSGSFSVFESSRTSLSNTTPRTSLSKTSEDSDGSSLTDSCQSVDAITENPGRGRSQSVSKVNSDSFHKKKSGVLLDRSRSSDFVAGIRNKGGTMTKNFFKPKDGVPKGIVEAQENIPDSPLTENDMTNISSTIERKSSHIEVNEIIDNVSNQ